MLPNYHETDLIFLSFIFQDQQTAGILSVRKITPFHTFLRSSVTPRQHSIYVPINDPFY